MNLVDWIFFTFLCIACYLIGSTIGEVLRERAEEADKGDR